MTPIRTEHARQDAIEARREELLTVKEYAWLVQKNPEYIRQLCRAGQQAGAVRVGGQWRIDVSIAVRPQSSLNVGT